jgi:glycine/D-amino acid oxidase-like deaminating enzyme
MRPSPDDGVPLIGPITNLRGVCVTVMHSGVTLASVVGRLVADELVNHVEVEELKSLRPMRHRT